MTCPTCIKIELEAAKCARETEAHYRDMIDDLCKQIEELNRENEKLRGK
jgi:hypothetical protein